MHLFNDYPIYINQTTLTSSMVIEASGIANGNQVDFIYIVK